MFGGRKTRILRMDHGEISKPKLQDLKMDKHLHGRVLTALVILIATSQPVSGQVGRFSVDGPKPATLEALIDFSSVIVEATVESAYPVIDRPPEVTSDFLIRVNKVVKGNLTSNQIAVHQAGGTLPGGRIAEPMQYSIMVPGERYILFLDANPPATLPNRGVPRYLLAAGFYGLVKVEGNQVVWPKGIPEAWKTTYRFGPNDLIASIQARSQGR